MASVAHDTSGRGLQGKVVLLLGAAGAQGEAIARHFAAAGARLALAGAPPPLADSLGAVSLACTGASAAQAGDAVTHTLAHFGRLDVLVNHPAVVGAVGSLADTSLADWRATHEAIVDTTFVAMQQAARAMQAEGGVILNLASTAGVMGGQAPHALTTAHHALLGLTRSAASELSAAGIRVNAVAPGWLSGAVPHGDAAASPQPGTLGVDDVAAALVYLASDAAAHVTAHTLLVDGGLVAGGFASGASVLRDRPMGFIGPSSGAES